MGSIARTPTFSLPSTSTPSPGPCPRTSAEGECTRRYSNGNSKRLPSSKLTSTTRERWRNLISVAQISDIAYRIRTVDLHACQTSAFRAGKESADGVGVLCDDYGGVSCCSMNRRITAIEPWFIDQSII